MFDNIGSFFEIIQMNNQSLRQSGNRGEPPNTLHNKDILMFSGVTDNLLQHVYNNVVIVFEGNRHSLRRILIKVRGCHYTKLLDLYI